MAIVPDLSGVGPGAVASPHNPYRGEYAGWTPELAMVTLDANTVVLQVADWFGGNEGLAKPAIGAYLGANGFTFDPDEAINILGVGIQGAPGNTILFAAGAPSVGTGNNGDAYINTTSYLFYGPKAAGAWPAGVSLIGPPGAGSGDMLKANNLSELPSKPTALTNLGLSANGSSLVTAANYAAMRTLLGLVIGTNVQAFNAVLTTLAGASANGQSLVTAANYAAMRALLVYAVADITGLQTALDAKEAYGEYNAIVTDATTARTLVLTDKGKAVEMNNASANIVTIPPNSSVAFPVKSRIDIIQLGAGQTSIAAGVGVTIRSSGSKLKLIGQYSGASLYKRGTDEWVLVGSLAT